uniref:Uncharacterized protein n=1 Tax=Anguilla anguilla TaxID=7936 RepID=A0A0E9R5E2_ANGAN
MKYFRLKSVGWSRQLPGAINLKPSVEPF